ncbi:MAG: hypothetical protein AB1656_14535 [Candidatus Omnitrophota bacterium]
MVTQLLKIWLFLNNKKTNIGSFLLLAAMVLEKTVTIWSGGTAPDWLPKAVETLQWLGGASAGVGLTHKGVKAFKGDPGERR